jgi:hypothetical protein
MYFPGTRAYKNAWKETIDAAEAFNEPGRFTAFIGFEWTSNTGGNNLHRNVNYTRVIEIPTPRWTAYDAKRFGVKSLPGTRLTVTERAYTSPIWYSRERG